MKEERSVSVVSFSWIHFLFSGMLWAGLRHKEVMRVKPLNPV